MSSWYRHELADKREEERKTATEIIENPPSELKVYMNMEDMNTFVEDVLDNKSIHVGLRVSAMYPIYNEDTTEVGHIYLTPVSTLISTESCIHVKFVTNDGVGIYNWDYFVHRNTHTNGIYQIDIINHGKLSPINYIEIHQVVDKSPEAILYRILDYTLYEDKPTIPGMISELNKHNLLLDYFDDYPHLNTILDCKYNLDDKLDKVVDKHKEALERLSE